jgi:hypothetical protein
MSIRRPAVAGTFYPDDASGLRGLVSSCLSRGPREAALAVLVPHAGYVYSGRVAGAVYGAVDLPRDVVLLCFNHRGAGAPFAVWSEGAWRTPLGDAEINAGLARRVREAFPAAESDESGHRGEHSGEVQVPFLQVLRPDVRLVPIACSGGLDEASHRGLLDFGGALAGIEGEFLVVASTDLNHDEDQATTLRKDGAVIAALERLDAEGLREAIRREGVSMCGFAPAIAMIAYARARGARSARTVMHATSGDVSGGFDRVVGYAGMVVPASRN